MRVTPIPPESQPVLRWRNGGGSTREILRIGPEDAFLWRASVARIDASGPFSAFPGYRRLACLLDGGPLTLAFGGGHRSEMAPRLRPVSFSGAPAPTAELDGEFARVFNLILAEQLTDAQLLPRPLVGSMVIFDQASTDWLIYLVSGQAELRLGDERHWLSSGHALLLEGDGSGTRAVLDGGGEVVLAKIVGARALP